MLDKKQDPWITRQARELRPHIVWDSIKESAKWLVAMAGGLVGIWQWLQHNWNAATAILVWVLSLVIQLILSRIEQRSYDKRVVRVFGKIEQEYAQQMSILLAQHQEKTDELLTRLKELQKDSASMAQQQQREIDGLRQEMQPVIVNDAAEIWNPQEQEVRKQWESLNAGARDVLTFMVRSGALPPGKVFAYLDQQGYQEKVFRKVQQTGLVLGLKDTYVVKFELKPYLDRIIAFENSNLAIADILRVRNTQKGIGDNAESPAWDIRKQDAHKAVVTVKCRAAGTRQVRSYQRHRYSRADIYVRGSGRIEQSLGDLGLGDGEDRFPLRRFGQRFQDQSRTKALSGADRRRG